METSSVGAQHRRRVNQGVFDRPYMDRAIAKGKAAMRGREGLRRASPRAAFMVSKGPDSLDLPAHLEANFARSRQFYGVLERQDGGGSAGARTGRMCQAHGRLTP